MSKTRVLFNESGLIIQDGKTPKFRFFITFANKNENFISMTVINTDVQKQHEMEANCISLEVDEDGWMRVYPDTPKLLEFFKLSGTHLTRQEMLSTLENYIKTRMERLS